MLTESQPLAEITQTAIRLLCQQIGVANTIRFLNQFTTGYGNYTDERDALLGHLTVAEVAAEIRRSKADNDAGISAPKPSGGS
jgi:hypothetical protein